MKLNKRKLTNNFISFFCGFCVIIAIIPLLSILYTLFTNGLSGINLSFFTNLPKPIGETGGGIGNAIQGTIIVVGIASMIGIPIGIFSGIYISEYGSNKFTKTVSFICDVLTGIPSIIAGIFGYIVIVSYFKNFSAIAGGIALSVLLVPFITRTTEESLKLVPSSIKEASLALGIPKWKTIIYIALSTARKGILTGVLLGIARISGETAPLLFTSFGNMFWSNGLDKPIATIPVQIYTYALTPFPEWHTKAWAGGLILVIMIFILSSGVRILTMKNAHE